MTIAEAAIIVAEKRFKGSNVPRHEWSIAYGDLPELHEIAKLAGIKRGHPLNVHQRVLNALDKSSLWRKGYFRARRGKARIFYLNDSI